ncbi:putative bifunctional diguanylate cyclase/phosphodiesterase [Pseudoalteromonas rubra]|uniref:putative bifunctional diguanylate cyclase/phosphodiesterase n=1 Tax=Pseudoalteromonas rubra TaxID=43658 RepID=UPI001E602246|nr:bifunctional diguanylate cyclase/phosphodiesterase [Pseudoalteromonas rubra]
MHRRRLAVPVINRAGWGILHYTLYILVCVNVIYVESLSLSFILVGFLLLVVALLPALQICQITQNRGWRVLLALIFFFVCGYLAFAYHVYRTADASPMVLGLSVILILGAVFVIVVVQLSRSSLLLLQEIAQSERHLARHDSLTELENRQQCTKFVEQCIQQGKAFSVLLLDINNFKQVNDALGHFFGDKLLVAFAGKLRSLAKQGSKVYRMGGDEFVIVTDAASETKLFSLNNGLLKAFNDGLVIDEVHVDVFYSAGARIFDAEEKSSVTELMKHADIAMYAAKNSRQSLVIFDQALHDGVSAEFELFNALKVALSEKKLKVFYQPLVCGHNNEVHGLEALLRWTDGPGSYISPLRFIPIAEKNNYIKQITSFVIEQVFKDLDNFLTIEPGVTIHINLSCQDFHGRYLINQLVELQSKYQIQPSCIVFELTESMVMVDVEQARYMIGVLIDMGFAVSIDDFGTGFSSFSMLRELPISQIKIDRSFVSSCLDSDKDQAIVETTIYLANRLGCSVVAEGVEDSKTAAYLNSKGCHYLQGYYISEALEKNSAKQWLHSHRMVKKVLKR